MLGTMRTVAMRLMGKMLPYKKPIKHNELSDTAWRPLHFWKILLFSRRNG